MDNAQLRNYVKKTAALQNSVPLTLFPLSSIIIES